MKSGLLRRTLLQIHLWVGLVAAIPLILIGLSGSALLAQREILYLSVPQARQGPSQPVAAMVAAAERAMDNKFQASWIELPQSAGRPASVQFDVSRRPRRTVSLYVDPVSLQILGAPTEVMRRGPITTFLVNIHEFLMMPQHYGLQIVGLFGVILVLMSLSGLILWWPRAGQWGNGQWKSWFFVTRGTRGFKFHFDLHHAVGIWGFLLLFFLGFSGIYLTFPLSFGEAVKTVLPTNDIPPPDVRRISIAWPHDIDEAISLARATLPDARVTGVQLPHRNVSRYGVQMEAPGLSSSFPQLLLSFDASEPGVVSVDDPAAYSAADRFSNMQYALHFAVGMGPLWTFLVFLSGLVPAILAVTGLAVWWQRRSARRRAQALEGQIGLTSAANG